MSAVCNILVCFMTFYTDGWYDPPCFKKCTFALPSWGGRVVRWCWVNFQCRGVLLIRIIVWQGPTALAVGAGAGGGCLDFFSLIYHFSFLSSSLWETAHYRLKDCLTAIKPKTTNQPTICATFELQVGIDDG